MAGLPITRGTSPDGRWAYTLYNGNAPAQPFSTPSTRSGGRASAVSTFPSSSSTATFPAAAGQTEGGAGRAAARSPPPPQLAGRRLTVDTRSLRGPPTATRRARLAIADLALGQPATLRRTSSTSAQTPAPPRQPARRADGVAGRSSARAADRAAAVRRPGARRRGAGLRLHPRRRVRGAARSSRWRRQRLPGPRLRRLPRPQPQPGRPRARHPAERPRRRPQPQLPGRMEADRRARRRRSTPGPRPFSEPETRLAARIVRRLRPEVTIWFHQHSAPRPLVRAWGQSVAGGAALRPPGEAPLPPLPWLDGTAPNWQNHRFPGTASFVVELPPGPLSPRRRSRLGGAVVRLAQEGGRRLRCPAEEVRVGH